MILFSCFFSCIFVGLGRKGVGVKDYQAKKKKRMWKLTARGRRAYPRLGPDVALSDEIRTFSASVQTPDMIY